MSEHEKSDHMPEEEQGNRLGRSVLVAVASLLGASMGASPAAPAGAVDVGGKEPTGHSSIETGSGDQKTMLAINLKTKVATPSVKVPPPPVSVKPPQVKNTAPTAWPTKIKRPALEWRK
jgi:hypothetical protein